MTKEGFGEQAECDALLWSRIGASASAIIVRHIALQQRNRQIKSVQPHDSA